MTPVWEQTDCELTAEIVTTLLAKQAAALKLTNPRFHDEGWSSWAYTANSPEGEEWILRFPKRARVAEELEREIRLLPLLADRLPLAIPRFELIGEPTETYPHPFVGYRMLPGIPAIECLDAVLDVEAVGEAIGAFLAALHSEPPGWVGHVDLESRAPAEHNDPTGAASKALALIDQYGTELTSAARIAARAILERPAAPTGERVLAHCDFFPEHVLLADGLPVGVIDWGEVGMADPAEDMAGLYYWRGEALLRSGLGAYVRGRGASAVAAEKLAGRAKFICVLRAADDLEYGMLGKRPEYYGVAVRFLERFAREVR